MQPEMTACIELRNLEPRRCLTVDNSAVLWYFVYTNLIDCVAGEAWITGCERPLGIPRHRVRRRTQDENKGIHRR